MNENFNSIVFSKLELTAILSSSLTIALSLFYILLSVFAIVFHYNCNVAAPEVASGSQYFWHSLYAVYIQGDECTNKPILTGVELTSPTTIFILFLITMLISILSLASAIALIIIVRNKDYVRHVGLATFIYAGVYLAVLIVDITFASHFGMDITALNNAETNIGVINVDTLRMGTSLLMVFSLKGFVAHIANITIIVLLLIYLSMYQKTLLNNVHSIHKQGALYGYQSQQSKRQEREDKWQSEPADTFMPMPFRGSHVNNGFVHDEEPPRTPMGEDPRMERSYDRSDSWHHSQPSQNSRPFSYLDEVRRPMPVKPPTTPVDQPWKRDPWQAPHVPAPDYSPHGPRRLKSALKPGYM